MVDSWEPCQFVFRISPTDQWPERTGESRSVTDATLHNIPEPSSWSQQMSWIEYAHNSIPISSTGMSLCSLGYQPPLFPLQEREPNVPSVQAFIQHCHHTWRPCILENVSGRQQIAMLLLWSVGLLVHWESPTGAFW